jgi:hypothetical protein
VLADFSRRYRLVPLGEYASAIAAQGNVPARPLPAVQPAAHRMLAEGAMRL